MMKALRRSFPQPLMGIAASATALLALLASWLQAIESHHALASPQGAFLALVLTGGVVLAYLFPIRIRPLTELYMSSVPLYILAVVLIPCWAGTAIAVSKLCAELSVRGRHGTFPSDIATQVGRWTIMGLIASYAAQASVGVVPFFAAAGILWAGDILTSPLLLSPATGEGPSTIIVAVFKDAAAVEAAQYGIGILGSLAAMQESWSVVLLFLPISLIYLTSKTAKDTHERARQLLASVVESSPAAFVLLDPEGRVITANQQAALLYEYADPESMVGSRLLDSFGPEQHERATSDLWQVQERGLPIRGEYEAMKRGGSTFLAEVTWTPIANKRGESAGISVMVGDVTQRKLVERDLEHRALHDQLTGLPNRAMFSNCVDQAFQHASPETSHFAVFLTDLDRFKAVNDTYGHRAGDLLLQQVGARLRGALRGSDVVARLGGDEFAVLLPQADEHGAVLVAERLVGSIRAPFDLDGVMVDVGISIGIGLYPCHGLDAETLLHHADLAMYSAKRARRGYAFYCPESEIDAGLLDRVPVSVTRE